MTPQLPRWSLAALSLLHAAALGAAAYVLPWPALSIFAVLAGTTAALHLVTAALSLVGTRHRATAWRVTSLASLIFLAYVSYGAIGSGLYINQLYDGVGNSMLAACLAAWCVGALFTLPLPLWGIAATGGLFRRKPKSPGAGTAAAGGLLLLAFAAALHAGDARGHGTVPRSWEIDVRAAVEAAATAIPAGPSGKSTPSLYTRDPIACEVAPERYEGATVALTFLVADPRLADPVATIRCFQRSELSDALSDAFATLAKEQATGDAVVDVVASARPLPDAGMILGPVVLRPGFDGVCDGARCLTPWQLFGIDAFTEAATFAALQADIGTTSAALRKALGSDAGSFVGLTAIQTQSFLIKPNRKVIPQRHLRSGARPLDKPTIEASLRDAAQFIVSAQVKDGRYRYTVQPFSGQTSFDNFSVPRQAGTTLALCNAAKYNPKARESAQSSLAYLSTLVQENGERGGIIYPKGKKARAGLGSIALPLIAYLTCRPLVGDVNDAAVQKLLGALVSMQRENGSFMPQWDPQSGTGFEGRDALYAAGQAVYALVLWEGAHGDGLARPSDLKAKIDRAMAFYAGPYWNIPVRDFFYLEENWHCLAAMAALDHHRNDAYERFCVDYMTMKKRFIERADDVDDPDFVGSYAFGQVFPPHHAAAAGFSEGLAAAVAVKKARGLDTRDDEEVLRLVVAYLLRHQWRDDNCAMCTRKLRIAGGYSENVASPIIRIDFVQHSMSGMMMSSRESGLID